MDALERNGLKDGSASDGKARVHPMNTMASIRLKCVRQSDALDRIHPMGVCDCIRWTQKMASGALKSTPKTNQIPHEGTSNSPSRDSENALRGQRISLGSQNSPRRVSEIPFTGLKIPLHGSQNSPPIAQNAHAAGQGHVTFSPKVVLPLAKK